MADFDERDQDRRQIGHVAIDAILRDAGQHVPQGPAAAALARRADLAAELPAPEQLSKYGSDFTLDGFSCCNAQELASTAWSYATANWLDVQLMRITRRHAAD